MSSALSTGQSLLPSSAWPPLFFALLAEEIQKMRIHEDQLLYKTSTGSSTLHIAISGNCVSSVNWILNRAPGLVHHQNEYGESPMHWAAKNGNTVIVKILIAHGCKIDLCDGDGATPLHWAAEEDSFDVAALLLNKGSSVSSKNFGDETPLDLSISCNSKQCKILLKKQVGLRGWLSRKFSTTPKTE